MPQEHAAQSASPRPYTIEAWHIEKTSRGRGRVLLTYTVLGLPLAAALLGFLGGGEPGAVRASAPAARLTVETPRVLRSGNWFETLVIVEPATDIADLTIAIDRPLWRRMSIDTLVPDAEKAESEDGRFAYSFGPAARGKRFVLKLDGQIQPHWLRRLQGRITLRDGDRPLVSAPMSLLVLP